MADLANSVIKSKFIARFGPGRAGFGVKLRDVTDGKNNRFWTDIDGTLRPMNTDNVVTITASRTILAKESGTTFVFNSTSSLVATLPAPAQALSYRFYVKAATTDSGTGPLIKVAGSTEKIYGTTTPAGGTPISESAGKGVVNTYPGVKGNGGYVFSDGTDWFFTPLSGVWARET